MRCMRSNTPEYIRVMSRDVGRRRPVETAFGLEAAQTILEMMQRVGRPEREPVAYVADSILVREIGLVATRADVGHATIRTHVLEALRWILLILRSKGAPRMMYTTNRIVWSEGRHLATAIRGG